MESSKKQSKRVTWIVDLVLTFAKHLFYVSPLCQGVYGQRVLFSHLLWFPLVFSPLVYVPLLASPLIASRLLDFPRFSSPRLSSTGYTYNIVYSIIKNFVLK